MFKYSACTTDALARLENRQLFLDAASTEDDPSEFRCEVLHGFPELDAGCPRFRNVVRAWGFEDPQDPYALEHYAEYVSTLEGSAPDVPSLIRQARLNRFGSNGDNLLLWTRHADAMRGFCLEFDGNQILSAVDKACIVDVLYEERPSVVDTAVLAVLHDQLVFHESALRDARTATEKAKYQACLDEAHQQAIQSCRKILATKHVSWKSEQEVRLICNAPASDSRTLTYPASAVRAIILGNRMPERQVEAIRRMAQRHYGHAELKQARLVAGTFTVEVIDLPEPRLTNPGDEGSCK